MKHFSWNIAHIQKETDGVRPEQLWRNLCSTEEYPVEGVSWDAIGATQAEPVVRQMLHWASRNRGGKTCISTAYHSLTTLYSPLLLPYLKPNCIFFLKLIRQDNQKKFENQEELRSRLTGTATSFPPSKRNRNKSSAQGRRHTKGLKPWRTLYLLWCA